MSSYNRVILVGNLTRDLELKYTSSGTAVTEIGIAVNRKYKGQEETTFVDCTAFGKTAELAAQYLSKGRSCLIEGRLQLDQWEDKKTGANRSKLKVIAESIQFLGGGERRTERSWETPPEKSDPALEPTTVYGFDDKSGGTTKDDVPF